MTTGKLERNSYKMVVSAPVSTVISRGLSLLLFSRHQNESNATPNISTLTPAIIVSFGTTLCEPIQASAHAEADAAADAAADAHSDVDPNTGAEPRANGSSHARADAATYLPADEFPDARMSDELEHVPSRDEVSGSQRVGGLASASVGDWKHPRRFA